MSQSKTEKEGSSFSDFFLKEDYQSGIYDEHDYITYDEYEEAELIIIPIEDEPFREAPPGVLYLNFSFGSFSDFADSLADFLCRMGGAFTAVFLSVLSALFNFIKTPAVFIKDRVILKAFMYVKEKLSHLKKRSQVKEYKKFRKDAREAMKDVRREESLRGTVKLFFGNMRISFKKHRRVWASAFNTVFPIVCFVVMLVTVNHYRSITFALGVNYNGADIGYISGEEVFNIAKDTAVERLSTGSYGVAPEIPAPTYSIAMLTPDKLSDSKTVCDKIVENTKGNYINACGIYIDGEFVCAVKNEADAINVFDSILIPYAKKAGEDASVAFVQEISYIQGFFSDTEDVIWSTDKLKKEMNSQKSGAVYYTVKKGDTPISIAAANHIYLSELVKLNPSIDEKNIRVGDKLLISAQVNYIRVKVMKTETRQTDIDYETVTKETQTLYKGTSKTMVEGEKGKQDITEIVTYIDGVKTYSAFVSSKVVKKPVDEVIYKGIKEIVKTTPKKNSSGKSGGYNGDYSGYIKGDPNAKGAGFGSPMASSYYYSSSYGYRTIYGRYSFHRGADLCHAGGSAGIPVLAVQSGTVVKVTSSNRGYGYSVLISHGNGLQTRYAHMQAGSISVRVGQKVSKGQQIGRVGRTGNATGNHLHFEVIKNGVCVNPRSYIR